MLLPRNDRLRVFWLLDRNRYIRRWIRRTKLRRIVVNVVNFAIATRRGEGQRGDTNHP
jgi:hypothetical protein